MKAVVDLGAVDREQRLFAPSATDVERGGKIAAGDAGQHLEHADGVVGEMRHALDIFAIEKGLAGARGGQQHPACRDVDGLQLSHFGRRRRVGRGFGGLVAGDDEPVAIVRMHGAKLPRRENLAQQILDARRFRGSRSVIAGWTSAVL